MGQRTSRPKKAAKHAAPGAALRPWSSGTPEKAFADGLREELLSGAAVVVFCWEQLAQRGEDGGDGDDNGKAERTENSQRAFTLGALPAELLSRVLFLGFQSSPKARVFPPAEWLDAGESLMRLAADDLSKSDEAELPVGKVRAMWEAAQDLAVSLGDDDGDDALTATEVLACCPLVPKNGVTGMLLDHAGPDGLTEFFRAVRRFHGTDSMTIEDSLRLVLQSCVRLPGEAQRIDRVLTAWATVQAETAGENGPDGFALSEDTIYILAFSMIMLNTDAHNPNVKHKMDENQFISSNRGIDDGGDLPEEFMRSCVFQPFPFSHSAHSSSDFSAHTPLFFGPGFSVVFKRTTSVCQCPSCRHLGHTQLAHRSHGAGCVHRLAGARKARAE
jgi:Sec7 domain